MTYRDATLNSLIHDPELWGKGLETGVAHDALIRGLEEFTEKWLVRCSAAGAKEDGLAQPFWNELLPILGVTGEVWEFEKPSTRKSTGNTGEMDVFIPQLMLVENKSPRKNGGRALDEAMEQAWDYVEGFLTAGENQKAIRRGEQPRFIVGCNLLNFRIYDRVLKVEEEFPLADLPRKTSAFWFITGASRSTESVDVDLDRRAAGLMANVYDELVADGVEESMAASVVMRLMFLCVADDLNLLGGAAAFTEWLDSEVREDGSDLGVQLMRLFRILDTPREERLKTIQENPHLNRFPYANGSMFNEPLDFDIASPTALRALRRAARYDWSNIDPAIFGAMFQRLRSREDRHALGQHYTSETDILRVINPLFLDDLRERFTLAHGDARKLNSLREDIKQLRFLDPAAGSGNFLLVAFKYLAALDLAILHEIKGLKGRSHHQMSMVDTEGLVGVSLDQFHGIEIDSWPAELARTALHIARAQANRAVEREFGLVEDLTFPLPTWGVHGGVVHGNALELDWSELVPFRKGTFVFGNPPFLGTRLQSAEQKADQRRIWGSVSSGGTVDFVTNWFLLAARYMEGTRARAAFVSTNSITQGGQPAVLWGQMYPLGMGIDFAYRTFPWRNGAGQQAAVHCVIIGFSGVHKPTSRLLVNEGGQRTEASNINAYLVDGPDVLVTSRQSPLVDGIPPIDSGSIPRDGGHLSNLKPVEAEHIRLNDPVAAKYLRRLVGSDELINGKERYCLWLENIDPKDAVTSPELKTRIQNVKEYRLASDKSRPWATTPHLFAERHQPSTAFIAIPSVSSETRPYIPMSIVDKETITNNGVFTVSDGTLWLLGLLISRPFVTWNATISSRLKSDIQLSAGMSYNNFPFPDLDDSQRVIIANLTQKILDARAAHPDATLANLYSNKTFYLYTDLKTAHDDLDEAVLATYGLSKKATDLEILKELFQRYDTLK